MDNTTQGCYSSLLIGFPQFLIGIVVNVCALFISVLIVITTWLTPGFCSNIDCYIASIAASDMLLSGNFMINSVLNFSHLQFSKYITTMLATYNLAATYSLNFSSCFNLALVAIDRYIYIASPFYYIKHMTKPRTFTLIVVAWIFSLIYLSCALIFYRGVDFHEQCIFLHPPVEYYTFGFIACIVAYVVICVCYFRIARLAFERKKARNAGRQQHVTPNEAVILATNWTNAERSIKFFVAMFGTYFLCYTPPYIVVLMPILSYDISPQAYAWGLYFFHTHSLVNLCIYLKMSSKFRNGIKKHFAKCFLVCRKQ